MRLLSKAFDEHLIGNVATVPIEDLVDGGVSKFVCSDRWFPHTGLQPWHKSAFG